ncbi:hypothetical protein [Phaeobacter phage MD18]|nr:hypothetical protein [Phaeobacter phage MD18]
MFGKKKVAPTTVAEAIAPFREVKDNLVAVIKSRTERRATAERRIDDAKKYAEDVRVTETAVANAADAEILQAQKVIESLSAILGDPSQEQLAKEQASAHA